MTAFQIGKIVGFLIFPFILLFVIGGIYYAIKRPNKPFMRVVFSVPIVSAVLVITALSLIGQFQRFNAQNASHTYPSTVVQSFLGGCKETAAKRLDSGVADKVCNCAIESIQAKYTYGEFQKVFQTVNGQDSQIPPEARGIIVDCARKNVPGLQAPNSSQ